MGKNDHAGLYGNQKQLLPDANKDCKSEGNAEYPTEQE